MCPIVSFLRDVRENRVMELNGNVIILTYAVDIIILGNSRHIVTDTVEKL